jgi:recombinational DNA repair protein RecR
MDIELALALKEIADLKAQVEKMKCCGNCRWEQPSSFCDDCKRLEGQIFADTLTSDNWEIKEND